jgi:hypothetical protein
MRLFADATVECSNKLVAGLKEINDTTKQMKTEEMELELRIHEETMRYKQEKDHILLENAWLALINQGVVVAAMAGLADAIRGTRAPPASTSPPRRSAGTNQPPPEDELPQMGSYPPETT